LQAACEGNESEIEKGLTIEEQEQRIADKKYWEPLKLELEQMRRKI
jgi:hypothetical protein